MASSPIATIEITRQADIRLLAVAGAAGRRRTGWSRVAGHGSRTRVTCGLRNTTDAWHCHVRIQQLVEARDAT